MCGLLDAVRRIAPQSFDPLWIERIYTKSCTHAKQLSAMAYTHMRRNKTSFSGAPPLRSGNWRLFRPWRRG